MTADPGDFNDPCSLFGSKTKQFLVREGEREREMEQTRKRTTEGAEWNHMKKVNWVFVSMTWPTTETRRL